MWGATRLCRGYGFGCVISIHAPRVGSDVVVQCGYSGGYYFNPRSPCGERLSNCPNTYIHSNFNPRSPCGERLRFVLLAIGAAIFQSTLPVWGATLLTCSWRQQSTDFNPRSPCGERLCGGDSDGGVPVISIHAPRVGSDYCGIYALLFETPISIHAPRVGSDH